MSTTKGRHTVKDQNGNPIFIDTVPKKSALQGVLTTQDTAIAQINAMQAALSAFATSCESAVSIANINTAATTLATALAAIVQAASVNLK